MPRPLTISRSALILGSWALLIGVVGCGPATGGSCNTANFACADEATALECRAGVWTELPCRGPDGCAVEEGRVQCDMSLNQPGDRCPLDAQGQGTCKTPELNAVLECHDGVLVQTRSCSNCFGSGQELVCLP